MSLLVRADLAGSMEGMGVYRSPDPGAWEGVVEQRAGGRGILTWIQANPGPLLVVKALLRGGAMGRLNRRWHGSAKRLFREAALSHLLGREGVPSPAMLFGRAERFFGFLHLLHLASEALIGARSLAELLRAPGEEGDRLLSAFGRAGRTVRALHDAGVAHRDLHLGNLLAVSAGPDGSETEVMVIDLDRSRLGAPLSRAARAGNLARLYRYAAKNGFLRHALWDRCWTALLRGYGQRGEDPAALGREAVRRYRRSLVFHRLSWMFQRGR